MCALKTALSIRIEDDPVKLIFKNDQNKSLEIDTRQSANAVGNFAADYSAQLESIKNYWVHEIKPSNWNSAQGLKALITAAGSFWFLLVRHRAKEIADFCNAAIPDWGNCTSSAYEPKYIEVLADSDKLFPIDMLPLFGFDLPKSDQIQDLHSAAAQIPAFSCMVRRIIRNYAQPTSNFQQTEIDNNKRLNFRFFQYEENWGLETELNLLRHYQDLELRGPWPNREMEQLAFETEFTKMLFFARANTAEEIDHIQHFSCHYYNELVQPNTDTLRLGHLKKVFMRGNQMVENIIPYQMLSYNFLINGPRPSDEIYPLVFINACASVRRSLLKPYSLPDLLLSVNNRGVIGTEASIPETFASLFARDFYRELLQRERVGQALFKAKWRQIIQYNNYLGFLYSMYVNPELRLKNHVS